MTHRLAPGTATPINPSELPDGLKSQLLASHARMRMLGAALEELEPLSLGYPAHIRHGADVAIGEAVE